jgi:hypothetical protein
MTPKIKSQKKKKLQPANQNQAPDFFSLYICILLYTIPIKVGGLEKI